MSKGKFKYRIMVITDGPLAGTGFSEEAKNIFYRLVQTGEFEVIWFNITGIGFPVDLPDTLFGDIPHKGATIKVIGNRGNPHNFGAPLFQKHYLKHHPEIVFFMGDPRIIEPYVDERLPISLKDKFHFPLFFYCTLDGLPVHPKNKVLTKADVLIAMTEWAQMEFAKLGLQPATIHHGIDWNWWSNNPKTKAMLRRKYRRIIPEDCTLFINWEVPQHRKRIDALLRAWKAFKPESKNTKLLIYGDWNMGEGLGWDIEDLIEQYDIPRDTIISPTQLTGTPKYWGVAEPIEQVRDIARMGDVYVSTTSGEGFGKCPLEAMSLGTPVIITDYSACSEVCKKGSILVPTYEGQAGRFRWHDKVRGVEGGIVNEDKFAHAMLQLYNHPEERVNLGKQARLWAREFDYDTKIIPLWINLFKQVSPEKLMMKELLQL